MTQPIVFNERGPVEFGTLEGTRGASNPLAPPPVAAPEPGMTADGALDFDAIHAREAAAAAENGRAARAAELDQAALEAQRSKTETGLTQFARGALSALLAPGALAGQGLETAGALAAAVIDPTLPEGMKQHNLGRIVSDFGRSLGRASTGRSAIEAFGAIGSLLAGETDDEVTTAADMARIAVDEQERAWPLLSAGAQIGGGLAFGLATGAGAAGGLSAGAKGLAALGAYEGAAAGAQAAYDVDAPLTEVWTSSLMGATIGAGLSQVPAVAGKLAQKSRAGLAKVFGEGETLSQFADGRVAHSLGFTKRLYRKYGEEEVRRVAQDIDSLHLSDGTPVFPKDVLQAATLDKSDIAHSLTLAHQEVGAEIGALRARASQFIDAVAPDLRPSPTMLASRIEQEVAAPLAASASQADRTAAAYIQQTARNLAEMGDSASLESVVAARQAIGKELGDKFQNSGTHIDSMKRVYGIIQDDLAKRFELAAEGMGEAGSAFRGLNRKYTSIERGLEALEDGVAGAHGNNMLGLSSNIVMAGTLAGDIATGGGFSAVKALAAGVGHKLLMEKGPQVLATLARRFSRTRVPVDVVEAGGREAKDALEQILRARKFVRETGESAGPNPNVAAVGQNTAEEVAQAELIRLSGGFDPATWQSASRAPSPLARVLYRSPILDTVSQDLAQTVERTAALKPGLDFDVEPARLARLTRDADGPQAIGLVQQRVRELADDLGRTTPEVLPDLEASLARLETADVAGAMAEAHTLSRALSQSGAEADGRSLALMLGDDAFGQAGKLYRQLAAPPSDTLRELADPTKLRDALKTLELRGELSQQIAAENVATLAAYEARKKLTGEAIPADLKRTLAAVEDMWSRGEEAVTLDGTRLGRIVDNLDNTLESRVQTKVPQVPEQQQVAETVKQSVEKLRPSLLRRGAARVARGARVGAVKGIERLNPKERLEQYENRLEMLSQNVVQPDHEQQSLAVNQAPPGVRAVAAQAMGSKVQTLLRDMPKPKSDIHGTAYDSLSSDDIRRGTAMWEATMEPMSVFDDFARGDLDPDKVAYAWKQYPGLQKVAQLGVLDMLQSQLTPEQRSAVPDSVLTQLDFMLGFNGGLQGTVSVEFSQRMSAAFDQMQQEQSQPAPPSKGLALPTSKPTMTQRIAGAQ